MNQRCTKCNTSAPTSHRFCARCGTEFIQHQLQPNLDKIPERYRESYGIWTVTTEGDCEGRTTRQLGTYEGYLDEIAKKLSGKCVYSLRFSIADELPDDEVAEHGKVNISLDIDSKTWDMRPETRAMVIGEIFKNRPIAVSPGSSYAAVALEW